MSLKVDQLAKPLKVVRRIQETKDAVSLVLGIPEDLRSQFHYQAGQFITFFLTIQGEVFSRSYSLSSSPLVDKEFKVTIKKVPGGRGSNFLCDQVKVGDTLMTTPPAGNFFSPALEAQGTHYFLYGAGSGITPLFSILKTVLNASRLNRVTLIFCNRSEDGIIYHDELDRWVKDHVDRLSMVHVLSKPSSSWTGPRGRLDPHKIKEIMRTSSVGGSPKHQEHFLCGPVEFMTLVRDTLLESGVAKGLIKEENFGVAVHKPRIPLNESWTYIGPEASEAADSSEAPEKIIAHLNGERVEVAAVAGQSILETLLEAGAQPPYSCMDGACMACLGKVQQGRVYQEDPGILSPENIDNCETLTCQAKPLSKVVTVSYDNL